MLYLFGNYEGDRLILTDFDEIRHIRRVFAQNERI